MTDFPFAYEPIAQTSWAYLSSLLMLALFFKFNRFWSVRNFDLILIILLAPGILLIKYGNDWEKKIGKPGLAAAVSVEEQPSEKVDDDVDTGRQSTDRDASVMEVQSLEGDDTAELRKQWESIRFYKRFGYIFLFSVGALFLARMLIDPMLVRRPLLAPNLTIGGLVFLGCTLLTILFANIIIHQPSKDDISGARGAVKLLQREAASADDTKSFQNYGPGFPLFHLFPIIPTFNNDQELLRTDADADLPAHKRRYAIAAKSLAIIGQLAIVMGLVLIGYYHFNSFNAGVGMTVVYLMLPYTALYTGHVLHVMPGALLVWAILCFKKPWISGIFVGLATGVAYYPLFLLPLWCSFYWEKGVKRFGSGVLLSLLLCVAGLLFTSEDAEHFGQQIQATSVSGFQLWTG